MKKMSAMLLYLFYQLRYETVLFWSINALFMFSFTIISLIYPDKINFTIMPSGPIYVLVIVVGTKWITRSLSYLLRLGVSRKLYALGSLLFTLLYTFVHCLIILLFYGIFKFLSITDFDSLDFLHPSQFIFSDLSTMLTFTFTPSPWQIFITDFIIINCIMLISMLISILFHRLGKLGGYSILAGILFLFTLSLTFGWLSKLFEIIMNTNIVLNLIYLLVFIIALATTYYFSTKKISIYCTLK